MSEVKQLRRQLGNARANLQYNTSRVEELSKKLEQNPNDKRSKTYLEKAQAAVEKYTTLVQELEEKLGISQKSTSVIVPAQKVIPFTKISTTERQGFKRCRRAWNFGSYQRMNLEPLRPDTRLWFGTGIHMALDVYYGKKGDPVEFWMQWTAQEFARMQQEQGAMFQEELDDFTANQQLGAEMLKGYIQFAQANDDFEVIMTEQEFEVPIRNPETGEVVGLLVGRFDGICRTADGKLWLLEHKTSADKWTTEMMMYDDQVTGYLWAAQQVFGQPLEGVYFNVLRKKIPRKPNLIRNGTQLSKAKDIDTTYEVYLEAVLENGFDPGDYADILEILKAKGNTFFQREKVYKSPVEIESWGRQLYDEYVDMADNPRIYPNFTWDCKWDCDFQPLCAAMQKGEDWEFLAQIQYRKRDLSNTTYAPLTPEDAERLRREYNLNRNA